MAHRLVQAAVAATGQYDPERMIENLQRLAPEIMGRPLGTAIEVLREALDAEHFVKIRNIPGGPAPKMVLDEIRTAKRETEEMGSWIAEKNGQQSAYRARLERAKAQLLEQVNLVKPKEGK